MGCMDVPNITLKALYSESNKRTAMFKIGDRVRKIAYESDTIPVGVLGTVTVYTPATPRSVQVATVRWDMKGDHFYAGADCELMLELITERKSMIKELGADMKSFVKDNRQVIYWLAFLLLVDHFIFQDQFRSKLQDLVGKVIGKVEKNLTKED